MTKSKKKTIELALYATEFGNEYVQEVSEWIDNNERHVRCSSKEKVTFNRISESKIIAGRVKAYDCKIKEEQAKAEVVINEIKRQRQELLALPSEIDNV